MNSIDAKERAAGLRQIAHHLHPTEREELEEAAKFLDHYNALVEVVKEADRLYTGYALLAQPSASGDPGAWINKVRTLLRRIKENQ
jgi:hypothetical protein